MIWTPEIAEEFARETAREFGLHEERFVKTLKCESAGFKDPKIQSGHYYKGKRETSYGYAQFNLPSGLKTEDGRTITYEIAVDPEEAIRAAGYNFSIGNASHWTCWRML